MYKHVSIRILAISLVSVAVVAGCVAQPEKESEPGVQPESIAQIEPATIGLPSVSGTNTAGDVSPSSPADSTANNQAEVSDISVHGNNAYDGEVVAGKRLSIPKITGSVPVRDDNYHDTDNNAVGILQSPTVAMADFPRDRRQEVDWVKALDRGLINPRADLKGENQMVTMDMDILMKNTQFMPWVRFPHIAHTKWLACENCHPKIFIPQENANPISMNKVLRGQYCGVCHDKVAFSLFVCERCHSVPHEGSGPAWWK